VGSLGRSGPLAALQPYDVNVDGAEHQAGPFLSFGHNGCGELTRIADGNVRLFF